MPDPIVKYKVPCWITKHFDFDMIVEATSPINALAELHRLLTSSDPKDMEYVESQIPKDYPEGEPIDFHNDDGIVEEVDGIVEEVEE